VERHGLLELDTESAWLELEPADDTDAMPNLLGSSVSYRIAVGPQQGREAFMIRTIRQRDRPDPGLERVAKTNGSSLHAGVSCDKNYFSCYFLWAHRLSSNPSKTDTV